MLPKPSMSPVITLKAAHNDENPNKRKTDTNAGRRSRTYTKGKDKTKHTMGVGGTKRPATEAMSSGAGGSIGLSRKSQRGKNCRNSVLVLFAPWGGGGGRRAQRKEGKRGRGGGGGFCGGGGVGRVLGGWRGV